MSSAVAELEAGLQAMLNLKPPGVSGSRITSLTALCVGNIQKLYTHFKKAPGSHKLGVLYVVDSVTRKWLDQAKQQGQAVNASAPDGTYAAGVNRVTELIPILMNDILSTAPADQKLAGPANGLPNGPTNEKRKMLPPAVTKQNSLPWLRFPLAFGDKIRKLVDIWEKGQTFPTKLIESFKEKLNAQQPNASTTPPGSPPSSVFGADAGRPGAPPAGPPAIPANIMETLANLAKQSSAATAPPAPAATAAVSTPPTMAGLFGPSGANNSNNNYPAGLPPHLFSQLPHANAATPTNSQVLPIRQQPSAQQQQQPPPQQQQQPFSLPYGVPATGAPASNQLPAGFPGLPGVPQPQPQPQPQAQPQANVQQNLMFIQALLAQGLSLDQISGILSQIASGNAGANVAPPSLVPAAIAAAAAAANAGGGGASGMPSQYPYPGAQTSGTVPLPDWVNAATGVGRMDISRDQGYGGRSPPGRGRSRSRSPPYWDSSRRSPRGGRDEHGGRGDRDRGGRGRDYRQRSPAGGGGRRGRGSGSPHRAPAPPPPSEKWIEHDPTLPAGSIRVLSRTLFVGGVTIGEPELRSIFSRFGDVQTCIVNKEKRHAFVKMYTRKEAETAKAGMEYGSRSDDTGLRTRWGVGFGPRDCSDYAKGVSVIPIPKLTEADRKWLLTAPWGGSGGRPIVSGMVIEEPDIEIGAGVSSKAISRRMQTDRGGANGPRSTRREEELSHNGGEGRGGRPTRRGNGGGRDRRGGGGRGGEGSGSGGDELNYGDSAASNGYDGGHTTYANNDNSNNNGNGADASGGFPFGLTIGPNGMPIFPPGFTFPAPDQS
ncbi:RNA-binding protein [Niveomyces insectorum RCEF 264]|uniref:RNA-binding protein n=1 Tax=Niveomyces insectorum RCEF 264 TaxID=1081102 RepID=A0A167ZSQ0_9HYPO|nr:RNA-binding protein [Niveomyces insectorum RCEF 264]